VQLPRMVSMAALVQMVLLGQMGLQVVQVFRAILESKVPRGWKVRKAHTEPTRIMVSTVCQDRQDRQAL
jgi:hypothetical protein